MAERMPSLQEIADMPYSATIEACRKWIHPQWGKDVPEDGLWRRYKVTVNYSVPDSAEYTVWAFTDDEAGDAALDEFHKDRGIPRNAEYEGTEIAEIEDA